MKKAAVFGMILVAAMVLSGCSGDVTPKRQVKQEIVVACGRDTTGTIESIMNDFTGQSETTQVKLMEFSNESVDLHRAISSMLSGKEVQLDAMLIEDVWVNEFVYNDYLKPLDEMIKFNEDEYHPVISDFAVTDEKLYWYPLILDTGIMYYREDISKGDMNYQSLSKQSSLNYAVQGVNGEEMLCCAYEFINLTGSIRNGIELYKKIIDGAESSGENFISDFKEGDIAYMRAWSMDSKDITGGFSPVAAKVNTNVLKKDNGEAYATARVYGVSVNESSKNTENIRELLDYLSTDEVRAKILKEMGTLPLRYADYENPSISYYTEYIDDTRLMFDTLKFRPKQSNYTYLSRQARLALNEYLTGGGSIDTAIDALSKLLNSTVE